MTTDQPELCGSRYLSTSSVPNTRIVQCDLPAGHDGDHMEQDTESAWPACCPGETFQGDPHGMHTHTFAGYPATIATWEAWREQEGRKAQPQPSKPLKGTPMPADLAAGGRLLPAGGVAPITLSPLRSPRPEAPMPDQPDPLADGTEPNAARVLQRIIRAATGVIVKEVVCRRIIDTIVEPARDRGIAEGRRQAAEDVRALAARWWWPDCADAARDLAALVGPWELAEPEDDEDRQVRAALTALQDYSAAERNAEQPEDGAR